MKVLSFDRTIGIGILATGKHETGKIKGYLGKALEATHSPAKGGYGC